MEQHLNALGREIALARQGYAAHAALNACVIQGQ
jgi:hypothetical protein